jgi:RimJ/RimL family protein N-acetyltransferase
MDPVFRFIPLSTADLPLVKKWLLAPHVARWFGDPNEWIREISQNLSAPWVSYFRADITNLPVGFTQCYDTQTAPQGEWSNQPKGTWGIDYLIGRPDHLGKGYGSLLVAQFVAFVVSRFQPERLIADPLPENAVSTRTLVAAGFVLDPASGLWVRNIVHQA